MNNHCCKHRKHPELQCSKVFLACSPCIFAFSMVSLGTLLLAQEIAPSPGKGKNGIYLRCFDGSKFQVIKHTFHPHQSASEVVHLREQMKRTRVAPLQRLSRRAAFWEALPSPPSPVPPPCLGSLAPCTARDFEVLWQVLRFLRLVFVQDRQRNPVDVLRGRLCFGFMISSNPTLVGLCKNLAMDSVWLWFPLYLQHYSWKSQRLSVICATSPFDQGLDSIGV